jgi:hypothetical protein
MKILNSVAFTFLLALSAAVPAAMADDGYQNEVCSDSIIQVQDLSLVCDSPGAYYYGSGKYRNSESCKPGDKARIQLDFYIADAEQIQYSGGYALLTMEVDGSYSEYKKIYEDADLCSVSSLNDRSGNGCPAEGYYRIQEQFFWGGSNGNNTAFYPTVTVGFRSNKYEYAFDYGGANTNLCRGSTFVTWTKRVRKTYANAVTNFIKTFGILLSTIAVMGAFIWFLVNKPKNLTDAKAKLVPNSKGNNYDDENVFDFRKLPTGAAKNIQLVDF